VLFLECISPLGMEDGRIKDSQINVTGVLREEAYGGQARLHQNIPYWGAWCPAVSGGSTCFRNYDQHILIDLLNLTKITGIATQGREYNTGTEKVKNYKLSYRKYGGVWHFYPGKDQDAKVNLIKMFHGWKFCMKFIHVHLCDLIVESSEPKNSGAKRFVYMLLILVCE
jgi:hypothetical protein